MLEHNENPYETWWEEFKTLEDVFMAITSWYNWNPNRFDLGQYNLIEVNQTLDLNVLWAEYKKQREGEPQDG
jgi:hypothetical protein